MSVPPFPPHLLISSPSRELIRSDTPLPDGLLLQKRIIYRGDLLIGTECRGDFGILRVGFFSAGAFVLSERFLAAI